MKTDTAPDYLGLQVFTQMSLESAQADGDLEAGRIFGDLHNLAVAAQRRNELRLDVLDEYVNAQEIEKTKADLEDGASGEILLLATMLRVLAETTEEHANDLRADERQLTAEDADGRAGQYRAAYDAILHVFNN